MTWELHKKSLVSCSSSLFGALKTLLNNTQIDNFAIILFSLSQFRSNTHARYSWVWVFGLEENGRTPKRTSSKSKEMNVTYKGSKKTNNIDPTMPERSHKKPAVLRWESSHVNKLKTLFFRSFRVRFKDVQEKNWIIFFLCWQPRTKIHFTTFVKNSIEFSSEILSAEICVAYQCHCCCCCSSKKINW